MIRAALILCLGLWIESSAADNPGSTSAPILQIPQGSRAIGMGSAFSAVANDSSAMHYNVAGLSRLSAHEAAASFSLGIADNSMTWLSYGGPLPFSGLSGNGYASAGTSVLYSRSGALELNRTNPDGSFLSTENLQSGWDLVVAAGYSERVGTISLDWGGATYEFDNFLGLAGKAVHSSLAGQFSATAWAADAGYLVSVPQLGLTAGFSASNMGTNMTFVKEGDPLPLTVRYGAAYEINRSAAHGFTIAADGDYIFYDGLWHAFAGVEYRWQKTYALRLGYRFNQEQKVGLSLGLGVKWRGRYLADYSWTTEAGGALSDTHRFTLGLRFGGVTGAARSKARQPFIEVNPESQPVSDFQAEPLPVETQPKRKPRPTPRERPRPSREEPKGLPGWIY